MVDAVLSSLPDPATLHTLEDFRAAASVLYSRWQFFQQANVTFGGKRDMNAVLGYKDVLTNRDHRERYERGGIAGAIVDVMPDASWRGGVEAREDKDETKDTGFELGWKALDARLQVQAKMWRLNKLARLSNYACLLIGDGRPLSEELSRGNGDPGGLIYLRPMSGGGGPQRNRSQQRTLAQDAQCTIQDLDSDPKSQRFGLPLTYRLNDASVDDSGFTIHHSRILHFAEGCLEDDIYGMPALERVWNYCDDLLKVTGGGSEAFWLRANAGLHLDVDKDMALAKPQPGEKSELDKLKEQAEEYAHQLTRMMRTRGVDVKQLGSDVANFAGPGEFIVTLIAGSKRIPKRILLGSEMGEQASSQDRDNWRDQVNGYQTQTLSPYLLRPFVDRLLEYNWLPAPAGGVDQYFIVWEHLQTMTEQEKDDRAVKLANANHTQGETLFTGAEIRDMSYGKAPLEPEEIKPIGAPVRQTDPNVVPVSQPLAVMEGYEDTLRALEEAIESDDLEAIGELLAFGSAGDRCVTHGTVNCQRFECIEARQ